MLFSDNVASGRTLNAAATASGDSMTTESCINFCDSRGYMYAGTEYGVSARDFFGSDSASFPFPWYALVPSLGSYQMKVYPGYCSVCRPVILARRLISSSPI